MRFRGFCWRYVPAGGSRRDAAQSGKGNPIQFPAKPAHGGRRCVPRRRSGHKDRKSRARTPFRFRDRQTATKATVPGAPQYVGPIGRFVRRITPSGNFGRKFQAPAACRPGGASNASMPNQAVCPSLRPGLTGAAGAPRFDLWATRRTFTNSLGRSPFWRNA